MAEFVNKAIQNRKGLTMEIYEKVSTSLSFVERENATRKFWEENGVFKKSMEYIARADKNSRQAQTKGEDGTPRRQYYE